MDAMRIGSLTRVSAGLILLSLTVIAGASSVENVVLAGEIAARIRDTGPFRSLLDRSSAIDKRVTDAISYEELSPPNVFIMPGSAPAVYIGKTLLLRVYPKDASGGGQSSIDLARAWRANFKRLFPLAEPSTRAGSGAVPADTSGEPSISAEPNRLPAADWGLVAIILDHLALGRIATDAVFEEQLPNMIRALYDDVALGLANVSGPSLVSQPPHYPGQCPEGGNCPGCRLAKQELLRTRLDADDNGCEAPPAEISKRVSRRIRSGLKLMRMVDQDRYMRDRVKVGQILLTEIRNSLGEAE